MADDPIPVDEILSVLAVGEAEFRETLEELRADYEAPGRGLRIEEVAGGMRLTTRPEVAPALHRFSRLRHRRRLSAASLETLAVIAYRQPITAPEIQEIRGVTPEGPLKTLLDRRLVRIVGRKKVVGRPLLYGTTRQFLVHFGLNSTEDLPPMEEFERMLAARFPGEEDAPEEPPGRPGGAGDDRPFEEPEERAGRRADGGRARDDVVLGLGDSEE